VISVSILRDQIFGHTLNYDTRNFESYEEVSRLQSGLGCSVMTFIFLLSLCASLMIFHGNDSMYKIRMHYKMETMKMVRLILG